MKQTAVEWMEDQLKQVLPINQMNDIIIQDLFKQGKEMEKEQERSYSEEDMKLSFEYGIASGIYQVEKGKNGSMDFEQFIKKFKKK